MTFIVLFNLRYPVVLVTGTIIIGGDDFPDHGAYDPIYQEYKRGWKFVEKAVNLTYRTSDHSDSNGEIAILGAFEIVNNTEHHDPGMYKLVSRVFTSNTLKPFVCASIKISLSLLGK